MSEICHKRKSLGKLDNFRSLGTCQCDGGIFSFADKKAWSRMNLFGSFWHESELGNGFLQRFLHHHHDFLRHHEYQMRISQC